MSHRDTRVSRAQINSERLSTRVYISTAQVHQLGIKSYQVVPLGIKSYQGEHLGSAQTHQLRIKLYQMLVLCNSTPKSPI